MANRLLTLARADDLKAVHAEVDNNDPRVLALAAGFLAFMVVKEHSAEELDDQQAENAMWQGEVETVPVSLRASFNVVVPDLPDHAGRREAAVLSNETMTAALKSAMARVGYRVDEMGRFSVWVTFGHRQQP